jgi:putative ABC transport system ATP-binding protein
MDDPRSGAQVSLDGLEKTYGEGATRVRALRGVDLEIEPGQFVVLLGPSGSGKTTLLNVVGGIESPTRGHVEVDGRDLAGLDADEQTDYRRVHVGFVFQFFNLIPTLTARENVGLIAELTEGADGARVTDVLREVGLEDRMDHFPAAMSGGEQQRVAIARALVKRPPLLLCDEPTGALDLETGRPVLALLRRVNREHGCTMLLVTHNAVIAEMADRVVRMRSGSLVADERNGDPIEAEALRW